jgi:hypothetical protein
MFTHTQGIVYYTLLYSNCYEHLNASTTFFILSVFGVFLISKITTKSAQHFLESLSMWTDTDMTLTEKSWRIRSPTTAFGEDNPENSERAVDLPGSR